jgi:hypothetical protein
MLRDAKNMYKAIQLGKGKRGKAKGCETMNLSNARRSKAWQGEVNHIGKVRPGVEGT